MSKKIRDLVHDIQYTHDLTLEEVAKRIGRSRPYLSKVMNKEEENDEMYELITRKFSEVSALQETKKPGNEDYQARLISRLDDDLRELRTTVSEILKMLTKLSDSFASAEARQRASYVLIQFLTEEIAVCSRVEEKERKKLLDKSRKTIHERLVEANPANHK